MIDDFGTIELAPSNRSRCKLCGNFIQKGKVRLVVSYSSYGKFSGKNYYCKHCAVKKYEKKLDIMKRCEGV